MSDGLRPIAALLSKEIDNCVYSLAQVNVLPDQDCYTHQPDSRRNSDQPEGRVLSYEPTPTRASSDKKVKLPTASSRATRRKNLECAGAYLGTAEDFVDDHFRHVVGNPLNFTGCRHEGPNETS